MKKFHLKSLTPFIFNDLHIHLFVIRSHGHVLDLVMFQIIHLLPSLQLYYSYFKLCPLSTKY